MELKTKPMTTAPNCFKLARSLPEFFMIVKHVFPPFLLDYTKVCFKKFWNKPTKYRTLTYWGLNYIQSINIYTYFRSINTIFD